MGSRWFDNLIAQARPEHLPMQQTTCKLLAPVLADERAPLRQIAQIVLGDPALAIRVLHRANAAERRYPGREIITLEDAIHMIGTRQLSRLAQESPVDEACLSDRRLVQYRQGCARAWLAALLAQDWAELDRDRVPAEVALAALLNNLGELYWLAHGDARINRYLEMLEQPGVLPHEAEYLTLGENLEWLGYRLAVAWGLPEMVRESMRARNARHPRPLYVMLATQLARHALGGWCSPWQLTDLRLAAELLDLDLSALGARIEMILARFNQRAAHVGLALLATPWHLLSGADAPAHEPPCTAPFCLAPRADELARARAQLAADRAQDRAQLILTWLEGLHRGLGFNRVLFASLDPHAGVLRAEQLIGTDFEPAFNRFRLRVKDGGPLARLLETPGALWLSKSPGTTLTSKVPTAVRILTGVDDCLVRSVWINGRPLGLIYADRRSHACALDERTYQGFVALGDLAESALARLVLRSKAGGS